MALNGTYGGLKASIASWLKRSDLTSTIPDFVALAEARIARDLRIRKQVVTTTLTTTAGVQYVTLPSDFLEAENLTVNTTPPRAISVVTPELLDVKYPANTWTGVPAVYCLLGDQLQFGPTPDAAYPISLAYYQRFTALSGDSDTNWLLTNHPSIYLFAALSEAEPFLMNDPRATTWEAKYANDVKLLQDADDEALRSGSAMRVRTV